MLQRIAISGIGWMGWLITISGWVEIWSSLAAHDNNIFGNDITKNAKQIKNKNIT